MAGTPCVGGGRGRSAGRAVTSPRGPRAHHGPLPLRSSSAREKKQTRRNTRQYGRGAGWVVGGGLSQLYSRYIYMQDASTDQVFGVATSQSPNIEHRASGISGNSDTSADLVAITGAEGAQGLLGAGDTSIAGHQVVLCRLQALSLRYIQSFSIDWRRAVGMCSVIRWPTRSTDCFTPQQLQLLPNTLHQRAGAGGAQVVPPSQEVPLGLAAPPLSSI
jgi:hypothetical protein